jgi:hypothetical protein
VESNLAANPVPMIWGQRGDVSGAADGPDEMAVVVRPFESFDMFVVTHGKTLVRCAYLIVGDVGAAQDVAQIALVKVGQAVGGRGHQRSSVAVRACGRGA